MSTPKPTAGSTTGSSVPAPSHSWSDDDYEEANRAATFHPVTFPGGMPGIEIAGARVYVYLDAQTGAVQVVADDLQGRPLRLAIDDIDIDADRLAALAARIEDYTDDRADLDRRAAEGDDPPCARDRHANDRKAAAIVDDVARLLGITTPATTPTRPAGPVGLHEQPGDDACPEHGHDCDDFRLEGGQCAHQDGRSAPRPAPAAQLRQALAAYDRAARDGTLYTSDNDPAAALADAVRGLLA